MFTICLLPTGRSQILHAGPLSIDLSESSIGEDGDQSFSDIHHDNLFVLSEHRKYGSVFSPPSPPRFCASTFFFLLTPVQKQYKQTWQILKKRPNNHIISIRLPQTPVQLQQSRHDALPCTGAAHADLLFTATQSSLLITQRTLTCECERTVLRPE